MVRGAETGPDIQGEGGDEALRQESYLLAGRQQGVEELGSHYTLTEYLKRLILSQSLKYTLSKTFSRLSTRFGFIMNLHGLPPPPRPHTFGTRKD